MLNTIGAEEGLASFCEVWERLPLSKASESGLPGAPENTSCLFPTVHTEGNRMLGRHAPFSEKPPHVLSSCDHLSEESSHMT